MLIEADAKNRFLISFLILRHSRAKEEDPSEIVEFDRHLLAHLTSSDQRVGVRSEISKSDSGSLKAPLINYSAENEFVTLIDHSWVTTH
jgi:hypothetical protein